MQSLNLTTPTLALPLQGGGDLSLPQYIGQKIPFVRLQ